jgi:hypothetical protein
MVVGGQAREWARVVREQQQWAGMVVGWVRAWVVRRGVRGMCGPILTIIPACRTRRFCS